ncbi:serpin family protein [Bradyrhizobium cenepequi]
MTRSLIRLIALAALTGSAALAPARAAMVGRGSTQEQSIRASLIRIVQNGGATAQVPASAAAAGSKGVTDSCGQARAFEKQAIDPDRLRANSAFTLDVLARIAPQAKNITVSPLGLSSVLSTLYLGANERMRKAITATLHVGPGKVDDLRRVARLLELASQRDPRRFASYNGLFVDHRLPLKAGVSDLAKADGQVDLQSVDFSSKAEIDGINALVDKKTNGRRVGPRRFSE